MTSEPRENQRGSSPALNALAAGGERKGGEIGKKKKEIESERG